MDINGLAGSHIKTLAAVTASVEAIVQSQSTTVQSSKYFFTNFPPSIDFPVRRLYNNNMNKTIASVFILAVSIILAIILFFVVRDAHPEFGSFYSLLYLGLITFGLGVGIFVSGLLLHQSMKEMGK